ncbi:carcinoembryonic antigen-related cell adhesion molecule 1 isoform X2 [Xenopus laevis]|uniref:Carcinoembryonic antigen-related cell adhesion molecule 1 isoform X2 n=2 Tax=Xenopus laevis TaxID=8355 RepID=A0A1L8FN65_XENLA|nr:carcinoembryonic antigen-related cell adhesion molecule 1 isoform X2 [Xenopus laevis]OCT73036.1 hypothetical protein XELAEV_18036015mg [Xenopus laevis]
MAREKATAAQALCMRGYLLTALFSVWINLIHGIKIQPIPEYPVVNQPVTLSVSDISGTIISFSWYKGLSTDNSTLILTYILSSNPVETPGPQHFPQASGLPNGSLRISKIANRKIYTVQIQADSLTQASINLPVYVPLDKPTISLHNSRPKTHEEVTLYCDSGKREVQKYTWSRIDGRFPSGVKFSHDNSSMTIPRIIRSDVGQYRCEVENQVSKNISDPYTLSLYCVCVEPSNCTGICVGIVGSLLITFAAILLYMRNKYLSVLKTVKVNSKHDQPTQNPNVIDGTTGQNTVEEPSYPEYSTVDSGYMGLQDRSYHIYNDLDMKGARHG